MAKAQSCTILCTISQLCAQVKSVSLSQVSPLINNTAFITVLMGQWYNINKEVFTPQEMSHRNTINTQICIKWADVQSSGAGSNLDQIEPNFLSVIHLNIDNQKMGVLIV